MASGSGTARGNEFGKTTIVRLRGTHKATIVWLHDIGQNGADSARFVRSLDLPHIKWICPTAPKRPLTLFGGKETTAWCDIGEISENMADDVESLNHVASFVTTLFFSEPSDVKRGVGGIGLGAAGALYLGSCHTFEWVPITLKVVVGLKGWLPRWRSLQDDIRSSSAAADRATLLQILLTHSSDCIVPYEFAHKCAHSLFINGFPIMLKRYEGETNLKEVCAWLKQCLGI